jgi:Flp pilus assembly protein TadG
MTLRRGSGRRGQSLVEFGLILPIFLLIVFGIIDFGRAVFAYSTLNNAAREAARVAVVDQVASHITDEAIKQAYALDVVAGDVSLDWRTAFNLDTPNSCSGFVGASQVVTCTLIVTVNNEWTAATPIIGSIIGPIDLVGESKMIVEFACPNSESTPVLAAADCPLGDS